MLSSNNVCSMQRDRINYLQGLHSKAFLEGQASSIVGTLCEMFTADSALMYAFAGEAYKLFVTRGLCTESEWQSRYSELATYGYALGNMFYVYNLVDDKIELHTSSFGVLSSLASRGLLLTKGVSAEADVLKFRKALVDSKRISASIKAGGTLQTVRLDSVREGKLLKFKGVVPRSPINLGESLILPLNALESCATFLSSMLESRILEITSKDRVRVVTKNREVLGGVYSPTRVDFLLAHSRSHMLENGTFYVPSIGASEYTMGVSNIKLWDIDKIRLLNDLSSVDLQYVNVDLTMVKDYYESKVSTMSDSGILKVAGYWGMVTDNIAPTVLKTYCIGIRKYNKDYFDLIKALPDLFSVNELKSVVNKYGSLNLEVMPRTNAELSRMLWTGVFRVVSRTKKGSMSTTIVTNSQKELSRLLGRSYPRVYESEISKLSMAKSYLERKGMLEPISNEELDIVESIFGVWVDKDKPNDRMGVTLDIGDRLYQVKESKNSVNRTTSSVLVRCCTPEINEDGSPIGYYRYLDCSGIVSMTQLSKV